MVSYKVPGRKYSQPRWSLLQQLNSTTVVQKNSPRATDDMYTNGCILIILYFHKQVEGQVRHNLPPLPYSNTKRGGGKILQQEKNILTSATKADQNKKFTHVTAGRLENKFCMRRFGA